MNSSSQGLQEESKKLRTYYWRNFWSGFLFPWGLAVAYTAMALFFLKKLQPSYVLILGGVAAIILFTAWIVKGRLSEREILSYGLYQIHEKLKDKSLKKTDLKRFWNEITYQSEEKIRKKDLALSNFRLKINKFNQNIDHIVKNVHWRLATNQPISSSYLKKLEELAEATYLHKNGAFELSENFLNENPESLDFPGIYENLSQLTRKLLRRKLFKFLAYEAALIFVLTIIYFWVYDDLGTTMVGFFTLSGVILNHVLKEKEK